jgi:hypothetical protein
MIARFDHRPMLTALLALTTTVLVVVVITLATLLITSTPAVGPTSISDSGNLGPGPSAPAERMDAESYGEVYGWDIQPRPAQKGDSVEPQQDIPSAHYGL